VQVEVLGMVPTPWRQVKSVSPAEPSTAEVQCKAAVGSAKIQRVWRAWRVRQAEMVWEAVAVCTAEAGPQKEMLGPNPIPFCPKYAYRHI